MHVLLENGAVMPRKAHRYDAGFDVFSFEDGVIPARGIAQFRTGFHIQLPTNMAAELVGRSGMTARGITVPQGTIDSGYTGEVRVTLYNYTDSDYFINKGERIAQLIIINVPDVWFHEVESLEESERGNGGFGSTGR